MNKQLLAHAVRVLSMDAVQRANSGHPGMPMGMADIAEVLWRDVLRHNPVDPHWPNRDRFVLSNGHGAMLLYSVLHLCGYDLSIEDIKNFRQLHAKTPGHPELGFAPGVETTTGPLGQGLANAVGMALAEKILSAQFNRENLSVIDHRTYAFVGDGCLMEGISHEVCSLAGTWELGKLIVVYDDNGISIDGPVQAWFGDDTPARFRAYGWHVIETVDGHDSQAILQAFHEAQADSKRPSLICCQTTIGFGSPAKAGSEKSHGSPLGDAEVAAVREQLAWPHPPFVIPEEIKQAWDQRTVGQQAQQQWQEVFSAYRHTHPDLAQQLLERLRDPLPQDWTALCARSVEACLQPPLAQATRKASQQCLEFFGQHLPALIGGSADLAGSNGTNWSGRRFISAQNNDGNSIHFGVREFGMSAIANGLALHGGFLPYVATFLTFSDYARNALRMAALMKQRVIFIYTHDSIGLGEDGPTHQAVEHAACLRLIPNLAVWRPCDSSETLVAWQQSLARELGPSALLLSRQGLPVLAPHEESGLAMITRGGYILQDCSGTPDLILIASGSEISLAKAVVDILPRYRFRLVSMPCCQKFDDQDDAYRESVLPTAVTRRVAIEAGSIDYWYKYVGLQGLIIGMTGFGESAPAADLFAHFGFTPDAIVAKINQWIEKGTD